MAGEVTVDVGQPLVVWTQADSQLVADAMRERIIRRTREEHTGADGKPFRPYKNKRRKGAPAGPVDLTRSGKMLNDTTARGTPKRAAVRSAPPSSDASKYSHIQDRQRPWFGFTESEVDEHIMRAVVEPLIDEHLKEASASGGENV
jgi:hypothetical protein